jgi:pimeloyl-ACP methyl ester carboxylesterase
MIKKSINLFFVLCISAVGFSQSYPQISADTTIVPYGDNPAAGKYYKVRGIKIYAEEYGNGAPLLMIHGNGGSGKAFKKNIPYFEKHYRVIIADSRAQGKSVDPGDSLSFEMIADDEAALLDAMHIDSAYVIGWSDGGIVALVLAMRHPDKVIKLAESGADLVPDSTGIAIVPRSWAREKKYYEENKDKTFTTPEEKNHWKVRMLDWMQPNIPLSALQSIKCPALIIGGDHDMFKIEHPMQIYQNIPRAYLWIVPDSGHGTLHEHSDDFNRLVDNFFRTPFRER